MAASNMKFIDIGANLLDSMYQGEYNDKSCHPPDLPAVLERAWASGLERLVITAGSLAEARRALELAQTDAMLKFRGAESSMPRRLAYHAGEAHGTSTTHGAGEPQQASTEAGSTSAAAITPTSTAGIAHAGGERPADESNDFYSYFTSYYWDVTSSMYDELDERLQAAASACDAAFDAYQATVSAATTAISVASALRDRFAEQQAAMGLAASEQVALGAGGVGASPYAAQVGEAQAAAYAVEACAARASNDAATAAAAARAAEVVGCSWSELKDAFDEDIVGSALSWADQAAEHVQHALNAVDMARAVVDLVKARAQDSRAQTS
ncbi:hypothetical protein HYH03_007687 [Edaphochlamys debaryana]|uniref:Uncharacterized protein n=1 Tax=Edaphochlamys debaryana TaxID=47281 RepID=A0A835Y185_9CHLO|nr:hypothetical protein HYH03_007687 [Edaphochlamys debaryana]|eukprot:KAG2494041.1 hypothetical protein HYH03_007687 [Edaphochlamys debaryana]